MTHPCKFGSECNKPDCPFDHTPHCEFGSKCKDEECVLKHPCKFHPNCKHGMKCYNIHHSTVAKTFVPKQSSQVENYQKKIREMEQKLRSLTLSSTESKEEKKQVEFCTKMNAIHDRCTNYKHCGKIHGTKPCSGFLIGVCVKGENCKFFHDMRKICTVFLKGICKYGTKCTFIHFQQFGDIDNKKDFLEYFEKFFHVTVNEDGTAYVSTLPCKFAERCDNTNCKFVH